MDAQQLWLIALGLGAVSVVLGVMYLRGRANSSTQYSGSMVLDAVGQHRMRLLQNAFPSQVVLAQVRLDTLLRVVRAPNREYAQQRAAQHLVQFAVLGVDGRPEVLFESETGGRRSSAKEKQLRKKYALAKVAGIPMVRIRSNEDIASSAFRTRVEHVIEKAKQRAKGASVEPMNAANDTAMPHSVQAILPKRMNKFAEAR
jgi:hypothetical protein